MKNGDTKTKKDNRDYFLKIRVNEEEKNIIDEKFRLSGFQSKSQFIRTMIFSGLIIKDGSKLAMKITRNVAGISANLLQISVRLNANKSDYADEVMDLRNEVNEMFREYIDKNCESDGLWNEIQRNFVQEKLYLLE